jgi:hypothetical protein
MQHLLTQVSPGPPLITAETAPESATSPPETPYSPAPPPPEHANNDKPHATPPDVNDSEANHTP